MKRSLPLFLFVVLSLTVSCNKIFPSFQNPDPQDPALGPDKVLLTSKQAQELVQTTLDKFRHRGVQVSQNIVPANTMLYYLPIGRTEEEAIWKANDQTWVFAIGPNSPANGISEWLYLFVDALNGDVRGCILQGEIRGLVWEEVYKKDTSTAQFVLWRAETTGDPRTSAWKELVMDWQKLEVGTHAWVRRFDSESDLAAAFIQEYEPIDWSTKTLLLVAGVEMHVDYPFDLTVARQEDGNNCEVQVCRQNSAATAILWWTRALLVDKLAPTADVTVKTFYL